MRFISFSLHVDITPVDTDQSPCKQSLFLLHILSAQKSDKRGSARRVQTNIQNCNNEQLQWNSDFFNLQGKRKSVRKIREFKKSGVKLQCSTEERERVLFQVIGRFENMRVQEIGIRLYLASLWLNRIFTAFLYFFFQPVRDVLMCSGLWTIMVQVRTLPEPQALNFHCTSLHPRMYTVNE